MQVMGKLRAAGIKDVGLVTLSEAQSTPGNKVQYDENQVSSKGD